MSPIPTTTTLFHASGLHPDSPSLGNNPGKRLPIGYERRLFRAAINCPGVVRSCCPAEQFPARGNNHLSETRHHSLSGCTLTYIYVVKGGDGSSLNQTGGPALLQGGLWAVWVVAAQTPSRILMRLPWNGSRAVEFWPEHERQNRSQVRAAPLRFSPIRSPES